METIKHDLAGFGHLINENEYLTSVSKTLHRWTLCKECWLSDGKSERQMHTDVLILLRYDIHDINHINYCLVISHSYGKWSNFKMIYEHLPPRRFSMAM